MAGFEVTTEDAARNEPTMDMNWFVEDFAAGWSKYLDAVPGDPTLERNFNQRFQAIFHD